MDTPKKTNWGLIVGSIVVIVLIIWGITSGVKNKPAVSTKGKTIKIGLVAPLTGGGAAFGNSFVNGVKLAQQDVKDTKNNYEVIVEDDGTNPATSASAAQKLVSVDHVDALISMTSGTGNAVKPIAAAAKVPNICICSDISVATADYNFTNLLLPDDEASGWLKEAQSKGIKSIAILHQNQQGINAIVNSVVKLAPNYGIKVLFNEQWDPTQRDFKTVLSKATATKPDMLYLVAFPPSEDIIGKQMIDAGIKNISSSAGFGISATPALYEGLWYNDGNVADIAFRDRFEKEFPDTRFNVRSAPYGYDSYRLLINGFEQGDVNKYLTDATTYDGVAGKVTKDAGTRSFHSDPGFWVVTNGKAEKFQN
jgi:ABC-type branched-subunit amino acid transport system substrate-binding protein